MHGSFFLFFFSMWIVHKRLYMSLAISILVCVFVKCHSQWDFISTSSSLWRIFVLSFLQLNAFFVVLSKTLCLIVLIKALLIKCTATSFEKDILIVCSGLYNLRSQKGNWFCNGAPTAYCIHWYSQEWEKKMHKKIKIMKYLTKFS